jgi:hypothetical protein
MATAECLIFMLHPGTRELVFDRIGMNRIAASGVTHSRSTGLCGILFILSSRQKYVTAFMS